MGRNKRNKAVIFMVLVLLVGSLFSLAGGQQPELGQEEQECGFWCKMGKFLSGEGREKVAGEIT